MKSLKKLDISGRLLSLCLKIEVISLIDIYFLNQSNEFHLFR